MLMALGCRGGPSSNVKTRDLMTPIGYLSDVVPSKPGGPPSVKFHRVCAQPSESAMAYTAHFVLSRRRVIKHATAVAAGLAAPALLHIRSANAAYPDRPIKVVVANTPGGPSDLVGRMITAGLQQSTGKVFITDHISGMDEMSGFGEATHSNGVRYTARTTNNA